MSRYLYRILLSLFLLIIPTYANADVGQLITAINHPATNFKYQFTIKIDYNSGTNPIYIGYAIPGSATSSAVWAIEKLTYDGSGNVTNVQWSNNWSTFGDIWDNRSSLTYS